MVVACVALGAVALIARYDHLGPQTLYQDDAWAVLSWRAHAWSDLQRTGVSALGFGLLMRVWLELVGFSNQNALWLPFLAGVVVAPVFLLSAIRMRQRFAAALFGAAMLAASPTLATYSLRAKQYTFEALLSIALLALGWAVVQRPGSPRRWVLLGVVSLASCVFSFALVGVVMGTLLAALLSLLVRCGVSRAVRSWGTLVAAAVAVGAAGVYVGIVRPTISPSLQLFWREYYPTFRYPSDQFRTTTWTDHGVIGNLWNLLWQLFERGFAGPTGLIVAVYALSLIVVAVRRPLLAVLVATPMLLAIAGSFARVAPLGGGRTDVSLYAPIALTVVFGLDLVLRRLDRVELPVGAPERSRVLRPASAMAGGVIAVAIALALVMPEPVSAVPVIEDMTVIQQIDREGTPDDLVVVSAGQTYLYALYTERPFATVVDHSLLTSFRPRVPGATFLDPGAGSGFENQLTTTVWLLDTPGFYGGLGPEVRTLLTGHGYRMTDQRTATGTILEKWEAAR